MHDEGTAICHHGAVIGGLSAEKARQMLQEVLPLRSRRCAKKWEGHTRKTTEIVVEPQSTLVQRPS